MGKVMPQLPASSGSPWHSLTVNNSHSTLQPRQQTRRPRNHTGCKGQGPYYFLILLSFIYFFCIWVIFLQVCTTCVPDAHGSQKWLSDSMNFMESATMWMLWIELESSGRVSPSQGQRSKVDSNQGGIWKLLSLLAELLVAIQWGVKIAWTQTL